MHVSLCNKNRPTNIWKLIHLNQILGLCWMLICVVVTYPAWWTNAVVYLYSRGNKENWAEKKT